jgi:hypothetical protein
VTFQHVAPCLATSDCRILWAPHGAASAAPADQQSEPLAYPMPLGELPQLATSGRRSLRSCSMKSTHKLADFPIPRRQHSRGVPTTLGPTRDRRHQAKLGPDPVTSTSVRRLLAIWPSSANPIFTQQGSKHPGRRAWLRNNMQPLSNSLAIYSTFNSSSQRALSPPSVESKC